MRPMSPDIEAPELANAEPRRNAKIGMLRKEDDREYLQILGMDHTTLRLWVQISLYFGHFRGLCHGKCHP